MTRCRHTRHGNHRRLRLRALGRREKGVQRSCVVHCLCKRGGFARSIFHAITVAFPVDPNWFVHNFLQRKSGSLEGNHIPMEHEHRDSQSNEKGKERRRSMDCGSHTFSCNKLHYLVASKFNDSDSDEHGTSSDTNRTHPESV